MADSGRMDIPNISQPAPTTLTPIRLQRPLATFSDSRTLHERNPTSDIILEETLHLHPTTPTTMDRRGHDQPDLDVAYTTPGNPVSKAPDEQRAAEATHASAGPPSARRTPHDEASATPQPSALGAGARDAHARDAHTDEREPAGGGVDPLDGEQMRAPGEGDVMAAQWHKTGFGEQESLTASLEEKISDQKGRREEVKGERARGVDVGGVLGQSGGPATVEGR